MEETKGKEDIQRGKANIQEMLMGGNITSRGNEGINRRSGRRDKGTGTRNGREMRARLCDSAPHTQSHTTVPSPAQIHPGPSLNPFHRGVLSVWLTCFIATNDRPVPTLQYNTALTDRRAATQTQGKHL